MKKRLVALAVIVVSVAGCGKPTSEEDQGANDRKGDAVGKAIANAALQVSELDVSALSGITDHLEGACARNKFGLSEGACIQAIRERKDVCMQQTAEKYPGQLSNVDRMQEVVSSHIDCLFQK